MFLNYILPWLLNKSKHKCNYVESKHTYIKINIYFNKLPIIQNVHLMTMYTNDAYIILIILQ
jgi:hypothetical protein